MYSMIIVVCHIVHCSAQCRYADCQSSECRGAL
jgi:hypothetical protein